MTRRWLKSPTIWFAPVWLAFLIPDVDLAVSRAFFGAGMWTQNGVFEAIRAMGPEIIVGSFALILAASLASAWMQWTWRIMPPQIIYLAATLLIGPGLIVETILKPHWGRARPREIAEFGGALHYAPAWQISDQCSSNCSFVSGHAAVAFWLTAYAFILPARWRPVAMAAGILLGFGMGFVRMAQGAHFISDIATAGFIVLMVNEILARAMFGRSSSSENHAAVQAR